MRRILALLALTFSATLAPAQKRPITGRDLFSFVWIGDTQLSPSGASVCFVQTTVTPDRSGYQTALYLLDVTAPNAAPQLLLLGTHDSSPRWSPDGRQIAFLRAVEKEGKPTPPQLYVMPATPGASATRVTDLPKGTSSPQWTPNGSALTVESLTPQDPAKARLEAAQKARATGDEAHVSDIHIINRAVYRMNGEGYLDPTLVPQLYMVYLPKADGTQDAPWQLTGGRFGVEEYLWSSHGWLFYTTTAVDEPVYEQFPHTTLHAIQMIFDGSHPPHTFTMVGGTLPAQPDRSRDVPSDSFREDLELGVRDISLSPDGKHLAFHAAAEGTKAVSHAESDLWLLDLTWPANFAIPTDSGIKPVISKPPQNLTAFKAFEMGSGVGGDNTAPRGGGRPGIAWSADGTHLLDIAGSRGSALLLSIEAATGDVAQVSARQQAVLGFAATPDQKTIVALVSSPILLGELFRIDPAVEPGGPMPGSQPTNPAGNQTRLTHLNDALFSQLDLTLPQELKIDPTHAAKDIPFVTIDTFVQLPPGMAPDSKTPHPLILNIHGGPHSAYGWVFDQEMQLMAARGYVVDYPNPRGSTTYGQNFAEIIENNYPGDDFHDLMDTVDAIIAKGWADPNKLGVTGGSGGGLLTDWTVTQTNRFKAAVAQRDITDWANWWYTSDIPSFYQSLEPKSPPFDNVDLNRAHSPITFVNNIKTPMMFILGDADYRTPPGSGGEDFFRALKYKKIPTVMVRFPRESHELSRSGEPWHRIERLDNILNWFDEFLLGKCEPQYDLTPGCTLQ
jgi:dipeptidyl aminopeptidase/acylaminoacyl peptidase